MAEKRRIILVSRPRRGCNWKCQSLVLCHRSDLSDALCLKSDICFAHLLADLRLSLANWHKYNVLLSDPGMYHFGLPYKHVMGTAV